MLAIIYSIFNLKVDRTFKNEDFYTTNDDTTTVQNEYMPKWVKKNPQNAPASRLEILTGEGTILGDNEIELKTSSQVQMNVAYFPGIVIFKGGHKIDFDFESSGYPQFYLSPGRHKIKASFEETDLRKIADGVTFLSLFLIGYLILKK